MHKLTKVLKILSPLLVLLMIIIIASFIGTIVGFIIMSINNVVLHKNIQEINAAKFMDPSYITYFVEMVAILYFYFWYKKIIPNNSKNVMFRVLSFRNIFLLLFVGLGCRFFQMGLVNLIFSRFPGLVIEYNDMMMKIFSENRIILFFDIIIIAPLLEELVFRGVILKKACKEYNFWVANILQAFLFSFCHMNIIQSSYTLFSGILFGYVVYKYKNLLASVLLHMILNIIGYLWPSVNLNYLTYIVLVILGIALLTIGIRLISRITVINNDCKIMDNEI